MNYFDTDNRKFAKEFVDYGVISTDDTLPYKASEESAMGEYVHPLKDMRSIKLNKIKDKNIDSMNDNKIRLTESYLHNIIKKVLNENWMTFMNAARGRKAQADAIRAEREKTFPHSQFASERNEYDDLADELEKHAQHTFQKQHGKNGKPYQYDGESSDYLGRNDYREDDWDYETKHNSGDKYWNGEEADRIGHYRYGNGFPYLKHGELHDDTFDFADGGKEGWSGNRKRKHTMIYDKDGERYSPDFSSVGNEVSKSKDKDYNNAMSNMAKEMNAYYTGKAKYQKGKGWSLDEAIRRAIRRVLKESSSLNYRQLINMTDINDNDEWNAAAIAEEREELEGKIWRAISEKLCNGGNPRKVAFHFTDLVKLMDKFGFKYEGNDDNDESINFSDSYGEFVIWPTTYYPKMDLLRIANSHLS